METTFFAMFDPTWTHILVPNGPNKEFLKQNSRQERQKLCYYQFCDILSVAFLAIFALNFD